MSTLDVGRGSEPPTTPAPADTDAAAPEEEPTGEPPDQPSPRGGRIPSCGVHAE